MVTQEDIRHIEDTRVLSYNKLLPNGELIPLDFRSVEMLIELLDRSIQKSSTAPSFFNKPEIVQAINLNNIYQSNINSRNCKPEPMEFSTSTVKKN